VIGTLPPHLIRFCMSYRAVIIKDFDHVKDGDLSGEELNKRVQISNPITVSVNGRNEMKDGKIKYILRGSIDDFAAIFSKLCRASHSVYSSVVASTEYAYTWVEEIDANKELVFEEIFTEPFVVKGLSCNLIYNRLTSNDADWGTCGMDISAFGVDYITTGGLRFG
ncbi:hypothetical protein, partial [Serratia marcescens]|uniref:hypothetical protein n=1 Tax=Serratia marcescens TaxID=615 RepID=UPI001CA38429